MLDKYKSAIETILRTKGEPMGVNAIQRELNIPLSTLQKYLERQTYFIKTESRKWTLPDFVSMELPGNTLELTVVNVENSIQMLQSQLQTAITTLNTLAHPLETIKKGATLMKTTPVAKVQVNSKPIDERLIEIDSLKSQLKQSIKKQLKLIPEEYQKLLLNLDYVGYVLEVGVKYANQFLEENLYGVMAGRDDKLDDEVIEVLKEFQIGQVTEKEDNSQMDKPDIPETE